MKISGTVVLLSIEGGGYGILDDSGRKFLPVNMPNQLKKEGARITCTARAADVATVIMWGEPIYILTFETL